MTTTKTYKRTSLNLKIKQGKPELVTATDYLKVMKRFEYVVCTKQQANRFHPSASYLKVKIRTKKLAANKYKVIKL